MKINGDWFRAKLTEKGRSQRALARHLELDPASITLMLRGDRRMQFDEAREIASFLGETLEDVLRAAGLPVKAGKSRGAERICTVTGTVAADGVVTGIKAGEGVRVPDFIEGDVEALHVPPGKSALSGAVIFYTPSRSFNPASVGRLSVVTLATGKKIVANPQRGIGQSNFSLTTLGGDVLLNKSISAASPIICIQP